MTRTVRRGAVRVQLTADVTPGVSINGWTDEGDVEGVVGQSILSGVPVRLEALA